MRTRKGLGFVLVSLMFMAMLVTPCWGAEKKYSQGVTDTTIKVGTSLPITGVIATAGEMLSSGMNAAISAVNAAGGINGRKLELVQLDDAYAAQRSVANVKRLVEQDKVFALVNLSGTGMVPASYPYIEEKGVILWAPFQPEDPNKKNMFFLGTTYGDQARILADYLIEKGFKRPAIISWDNQVGILLYKGFEDAFGKAGVKILANNAVSPTATDLSGVVLKSRELNPDVLIFSTSEPQAGQAVKEARKLGWNVQLAGTGVAFQEVLRNVAGKDAEGAITDYYQELPTSDNPLVKQAMANLDKYVPKKEQARAFHTIDSYNRMMVFAKVLEMMGDNLTWENFTATAEKLNGYVTGIHPPVTFKPGAHLGTSGAKIVTIKNGVYVGVTDWRAPKK